jgi:hypothetical protein
MTTDLTVTKYFILSLCIVSPMSGRFVLVGRAQRAMPVVACRGERALKAA